MRRMFIAIMALSLMLVSALPAAAAPKRATPPTIASTAIASPDFSVLVAALLCPGNEALLAAASTPRSNLTVFAPTDAAFGKIGVNAGNVCGVEGLFGILADHIVTGRYVEGRVLNSTTLPSLGGPLAVSDVAAAGLLATNIQSSNGVIHVIDNVLLIDRS